MLRTRKRVRAIPSEGSNSTATATATASRTRPVQPRPGGLVTDDTEGWADTSAVTGFRAAAAAGCLGGLGEDDPIVVGVPEPDFPVARVGVNVDVGLDFGIALAEPVDDAVKVGCLEPENHAIADRQCRVADGAMVMTDLNAVQLQDQLTVDDQLLVLSTAMATGGAQSLLIPHTRLLHVCYSDHRLGADGKLGSDHAHHCSFAPPAGLEESERSWR